MINRDLLMDVFHKTYNFELSKNYIGEGKASFPKYFFINSNRINSLKHSLK